MALPFKTLIRKIAVSTPLRYLARPVYEGATALELAAIRALDRRRPRLGRGAAAAAVAQTTAIIKTFERPRALLRLIESLRLHFPALGVVVADDSRFPRDIAGVTVIKLPFDSGVSRGRQAALDRVRTPYTWLLDDDFVVYSATRLDIAWQALERHPELDILGGPLVYLPELRLRRGNPSGIFRTDAAPVMPPGAHIDGLEIRDKVPNFYLARTERLRLVGWTPELKRLDHADFFTRARGVLTSAFCDDFRALHAQTPFDREYQSYRQAYEEDRMVLMARHGLDS